jgi:hypothetical protein
VTRHNQNEQPAQGLAAPAHCSSRDSIGSRAK